MNNLSEEWLAVGFIALLVLGCVAFLAIIWSKRFETWFDARFEKRYLDAPPGDADAVSAWPQWRRWVPLPWALAVQLSASGLTVLLFQVAPSTSSIHWLSLLAVTGSCSIALFSCWACAFVLHYTPANYRRRKYEFLLVGTAAFHALTRGALPDVQASRITATALGLCGGIAVLGPLLAAAVRPWAMRQSVQASLGLRRLHGLLFLLGPVVFFGTPLLPAEFVFPYLYLRFLVGERMARSPIVYLRSFNHPKAPLLFGKVVAPVAGRYGVVRGLTQRGQTMTELHDETGLTHNGQMDVVPDEAWRDWVAGHLAIASVVIVDLTVRTDSIDWELEQAVKTPGASRTCILVAGEASVPACPGVAIVRCLVTRRGLASGRRQLRKYMDSILGIR